MGSIVASSGNAGPKVRSDCSVSLQLMERGGIDFNLSSKVKVLYGKSIEQLSLEILEYFGIKNAKLTIIDSGALPFVIAARLEAAIKSLVNTDLEYLPEFIKENAYTTKRDRFRFSRLYLPGNSPGLMINAGLHSADGIILDLEDSVAPEKKDEARLLVRNALRQINFYGAERMVRINQGDRGIEDLRYLIPHNVNLILIPKCESAEYVKLVDDEISSIRDKCKLTDNVYLMPVIESALGIENSFDIARETGNVVAIAIGLEDYTADLGVQRTIKADESLYARTRLVVAAKAAGIQPIDSVFSDIGDMDALRENVKTSKSLGFEGMGCVHPRQIAVIREVFTPDIDAIQRSKDVVMAYENARLNGLGVVALGSKMIDPPVVLRAQRTIELALRLGILEEEWKRNYKTEDNSSKR